MVSRDETDSPPKETGGASLIAVVFAAGMLGALKMLAPELLSSVTGVVAALAFCVVAGATVFLAIRNASPGRALSRRDLTGMEEDKARYVEARVLRFEEERERLERSAFEFYQNVLDEIPGKLRELVASSRVALDQVTTDISKASKLPRDMGVAASAEEWRRVIGEQWMPWESDLGYLGVSEIGMRIHQASESWRSYQNLNPKSFEGRERDGEHGPALGLAQVISRLRMESVNELMEGYRQVGSRFLLVYRKEREWMSQTVFQSLVLLNEVGEENATLADTNMRSRIVRLKTVFDLVIRMGDSIESELLNVEDGEARRSKVVRTCINLSILGAMPRWFAEAGSLGCDDGDEADSLFAVAECV
ncbi:hypothetical protein IEN85_01650 [Pelagicoccus sp. NFK12]|uniref:Uncharacterized protein n=1 Tax=Pelagicoccus enzymogenes TaxID=2773457 RepID=A0A927IG06_9BACT|nr:hypothetical protein [Pelagicoccus enzymogenes]MBD5778198.1 hypothetical protein [Pelagicoccus enzymogenes]